MVCLFKRWLVRIEKSFLYCIIVAFFFLNVNNRFKPYSCVENPKTKSSQQRIVKTSPNWTMSVGLLCLSYRPFIASIYANAWDWKIVIIRILDMYTGNVCNNVKTIVTGISNFHVKIDLLVYLIAIIPIICIAINFVTGAGNTL